MPDSVLYKSSSLIIYSSGLSESLKRPLPIPCLSDTEQNGNNEIIIPKRQKLKAPLSDKERSQAYRNRKKESLNRDSDSVSEFEEL
jgi:hypothetical protein